MNSDSQNETQNELKNANTSSNSNTNQSWKKGWTKNEHEFKSCKIQNKQFAITKQRPFN